MDPIDATPSRVLSARESFGSVARCPRGCFHVCLPTLAFRLRPREFYALVDMVNEAAERAATETAATAVRPRRLS